MDAGEETVLFRKYSSVRSQSSGSNGALALTERLQLILKLSFEHFALNRCSSEQLFARILQGENFPVPS